MTVKFDFDNGVNDITVDEEEMNDIRLFFECAGFILGGMLYASNLDIDKLDSIDLIGELLETARFEYNWRYHHERQEI